MYIGFMLLLCTSGALGAGLRRPRQSQQQQQQQAGGTGESQQGGPFGQVGQYTQFPQTQVTQVSQNIQNPDPQAVFSNQPFGNQQIPFVQQQQSQTSQSQPQSGTFFNRNPPQQQYFANRNPPNPNEPIPIISYENIQPGDGTYRYSFETGDGIKKAEQGEQRVVGEPPEAGTVAQGSYSYTDPEGNLIAVTYTADENGFRPSGAHFPTPPPVPQDIMAALEQSAQAEAAQNNGVISPAYHYFFRNFRRI